MCYSCGEIDVLQLDDTANDQRDAFAEQHSHDRDWSRWLHNRATWPWFPERKPTG